MDYPVFVRSKEGGCVAAALFSAVCVMNGHNKAKELLRTMGDGVELVFSKAGNMVMKWVWKG